MKARLDENGVRLLLDDNTWKMEWSTSYVEADQSGVLEFGFQLNIFV